MGYRVRWWVLVVGVLLILGSFVALFLYDWRIYPLAILVGAILVIATVIGIVLLLRFIFDCIAGLDNRMRERTRALEQ